MIQEERSRQTKLYGRSDGKVTFAIKPIVGHRGTGIGIKAGQESYVEEA
jgi:hypothetical protein